MGGLDDYGIKKAFEKQPKANEWLAGLPPEKRKLYKMPDPSCHKCYGRGHIGLDASRGWVLCNCMKSRGTSAG